MLNRLASIALALILLASTSSLYARMLTPDNVFSEQTPATLSVNQVWTYGNGDTYQGDWRDGKPNGFGQYRKANGDVYEGQFSQGFMHGRGTYRFRFGDVYRGQMVNGRITGKGTMNYKNGNQYEGEWLDGLRNGKGKLVYTSGTSYDGTWIKDQKGGYGLTIYSNGDRYLGAYIEGRPHGHGIRTLATGDVFRGTFSNGVPHGVGECNYNGDNRVCLYNRGKEVQEAEKLALAEDYFGKHRKEREFKGGIAYQLQDDFTNDRQYLNTNNVWWEKQRALLATQLRIHSKNERHYLYMIVNKYTGPGIYKLKGNEIMASTADGKEVALPDDVTALVEIKEDKDGEISGVFSVPALASKDGHTAYSILDGRFEAGNEPPVEEQALRPFFFIH